MFGVIVVFAVQVFLFGFTRAQCGTPCNRCKEISAPEDSKYIGKWRLLNPTSSRCDWNTPCLYQRDNDGKELCMCDPGPIVYEECKPFQWGLCYNYTEVDWNPTNITNNDVASCDKHCHDSVPGSGNGINTFFQLGSTNLQNGVLCGCSQTLPSSALVVDSSYCGISCPGRNFQTCGGFNVTNNNRYVNIWHTFPNPIATDGACYNSTIPIYPTVTNLTNNDVQTCNTYNQDNWPAFTYFGLGSSILNNGIECYTGWSAPPADQLVSPYWCWDSPCPGNNDQECGYYQTWNNWRFINVWKRIN